MRSALRLTVFLSVAGCSVGATEAMVDKRDYSWRTPVPENQMREMSTDRPDATESPFTIDPGHVQLEMNFASYARENENGDRLTEWEAAPFNLRFGITANFEAGFFLVPFRTETEKLAGGARLRRSGVGDTTLRGKWNFNGNDGGDSAWGLIVDVKLPTASDGMSNDKLEGAVTLPVAFTLGAGWEGAAMTSVAAAYTAAGEYRAVWDNTITAGHDLSANVAGFLELTSSTGDGSHVATFNCGVTRRFGAHVQLDAGLNVGLSRAAPDISVFTGLSRRF